MRDSSRSSVLAIDGGGTRCRIGLMNDGNVSTVETGSANVSTDFDGSVQQIMDGLSSLSEKTSIPVDDIARFPAFIGLAGVTGPRIANRLKAALPFDVARIEDDRPAALRGALGDKDGVIAHCGTGSFVGALIGGSMRFAGGWGPILGDEASAQWIGRAALMITLRACDGRVETSTMAESLIERFDGSAGIVKFAGTARPTDFGAIAPQVTEFAAKGDSLARRVMKDGAADIAGSLTDIGWIPGRAICLTGGIGPHFAAYLPQDMQAEIIAAKGEPLSGALSLAMELGREHEA